MDRIPFPLEQSWVDNPPKIFGDVKYLIEGNVDSKIIKLLDNGGAKQLSYAGLSATHMIAGEGADEVKLAEAEDVFEFPVVQPGWVVFSAKAGKLLPTAGFECQSKRLFSSIRVTSSGMLPDENKSVWAQVTYYGGVYQTSLTSSTTHLVTNQTTSQKYAKAMEKGIKIVCCDWITDCIKAKAILDEAKYHPKLLSPLQAKDAPIIVKINQSKSEAVTPALTSKSASANQSKQGQKVSQAATNATAVRQQMAPGQTILQVQLAGSQHTNGPRGRGVAVRQQAPQILLQQKQQAGATNVRAHRPLLVNTPQQQKSKAVPPPSQPPPPPVSLPQQQPKPGPLQAPQQQQIQLPSMQQHQQQQQQTQVPPGQQQQQTQGALGQQQNQGAPGQQQQQNQMVQVQQQQNQSPTMQQKQPNQPQQPVQQQSNQLQMALQQTHIQQQQQQQPNQAQLSTQQSNQNQISGNNQQQLQMSSMQQQIPMSVQSAQLSGQLPPQQQQHQNQLVVSQQQQQQQQQSQNSQPQQQQHSIQLQQQLQSQQQMNSMQQQQQQMHHPSQLHQQLQGQLHIQQQQQLQIQQSNQLQTALSQQSQAPQTLPTQVQVITHPQQGGMQLHLQSHQIVSQSQQQSVLQNQLQQIQHSVMQHQSQQIQHLQQQHNVQHQQLGHPQNQPGMQQGHQILQQQQPQQGMQIQRPPSQQGHPMHIQQQMQNQMGQPHQGVQISGMQFSQHNQQQLLQQQQHQHQLQIQQQQHNLQHMQPNLSNQQQSNLQSQTQQVLQPQKSPLPITTQPMQTVQGQPQQPLHIQQNMPINQQSGIQLGISPLQGLQQQQQAYQIQSQQQQQNQQLLQQQQQQQQQFISPVPSKTPPQQLHPQSPQHQQIMQAQGGMRPPGQPGQQQSVQFQILQPQNRLQVVMGIPQKPQQYQQQQSQQNPQGPSNISIANQQQVFRQQQPHQQQGVVSQGIKPQGQLYHSLQQQQQQQQQQRPQGMMQIQQQPQQGPGGHSIQVMQGGQPGHPPTSHSQTGVSQLQPILSPQQLNKFQEIGPSSGQQLQQGGQHYNVVIHQGQQYAQMNPPPPRPQQQPRHPGKPGSIPNQPQLGQRVGPIPHGGPPRPGAHQWAHQHTEIIRQFQSQMDPVFKAKFSQMDPQQQQLFIQKYIQRSREEQLRKEMMLRQQQLNQQNAAMQGQSPGQPMTQPQQGVPGSPQQHLAGQPQSQTILVQQGVPQASQSPGGDKPLGMQSQQGSPALVPQPTQSPLSQSGSPQLQQGPQPGQIPGSPGVNPAANQQQQQQILMQNQLLAQQQNQQKMLNPRAQSPTQKFPPPSPIQPMQTRSPTHPGIPGQQPQASGTIVRTQQVFTPQVAQHGQQQPRMVLVQQGGVQNQQGRFPQHQIILQQHQQAIPGQGQPQQKVAILQQPHQSPSQPGQGGGQWIPGTSQPQRLGSPTQSTTQFPPRMQSPDAQQRSPGQVWNVRAQPGNLITPGSPGTPNAAPYVQVVNSKTKTALANLLNNRLQGNSTGIDSSTTTSTGSSMVTPSTSTTLTMCPSSQNLPVSSSQSQQLPLQHPVTQPSSQTLNVVNQRRTLSNLTNSCKTIHQVNSYGTAAARAGLSQSPTSVAISSTRIPFYGYEPNFKPPQNGFLIGCVFWAAQSMDDSNWRRTIILYGGEILNEYNAMKVTHVLCNNQKFPEFQQVLRDGKRLVTLHWLSDTCCRKVMAPPFYAMHLPTPYNEDNLPLKGQPFSMTGFEGEDRERVLKMLKLLGAECTPYFTKLNKGLVAFRSEGAKFTKAREWKLPVVNIQFLNELLLGNSSCLQMIHSPKYQHFTLEQPFRFDININPNLMAAWKTPIRVSNDILEKFKTGKRPLENPNEDGGERAKRIKLIDDEKTQLSYLTEAVTEPVKQENDSKNDIENKRPPVVMFTGFSEKFKTQAKEQVVALGGRVTIEIKEATHLVCWEIVTSKLYSALCRVKYIVGAPWIRDSVKAKRFVDESTYISCVENFEKHHKVTIAEVLKKPDRHLLFKGMTFFITPGIIGQSRRDLENIVESGGGQSDKLQKSMTDVRLKARKNPRKYIVITSPEDFEMFSDFFFYKPSKPLSVFTTHFLYKCVADQKVDFGPLPSKKATQKVGPANSA